MERYLIGLFYLLMFWLSFFFAIRDCAESYMSGMVIQYQIIFSYSYNLSEQFLIISANWRPSIAPQLLRTISNNEINALVICIPSRKLLHSKNQRMCSLSLLPFSVLPRGYISLRMIFLKYLPEAFVQFVALKSVLWVTTKHLSCQ